MGEKEIIYEDEFNRWAEAWEIDPDTDDMTQLDKDDFIIQKAQIIKAMKKGRMKYIDETEAMEYTVSRSKVAMDKPISMRRSKGTSYIGMDKYKDREGVHKTFSMMAEMCGVPVAVLSNLDGIDLKPLMAVANIFLAT